MNKTKLIAFSVFILSAKFAFSQYLIYPDYDARLIQPLVNGLSHPHVCVAPDGWNYLTGTVGDPNEKFENDGIYLWKSKDLTNWQELGKVFDVADITWQSRGEPVYGTHHSKRRMGCRGAELHFVKGAYYLVYSTVYQSEWEILFGGQRFAAAFGNMVRRPVSFSFRREYLRALPPPRICGAPCFTCHHF